MSDPSVHLISFWVGCGATSTCECDDIFMTPLHGRLPSWKDCSSPRQEELPVKEVKTLIIVEFGCIVHLSWIIIFSPPPWPEAKKNHLRSKWIFLAFGQGGGHLIFDACFDFQCATPRGLIRWVTVWGNGSLLGLNSIFHCATPRGLIR